MRTKLTKVKTVKTLMVFLGRARYPPRTSPMARRRPISNVAMIQRVLTLAHNTSSIPMEALSSQHGGQRLRPTPSTMFRTTSHIKHHTQLRSQRMRLTKRMRLTQCIRKIKAMGRIKRISKWPQATDLLLNMAQWQT